MLQLENKIKCGGKIMNDVMYCEKCGHVGYVVFCKKCKNCGIKMKLLPESLKYKYHIFVEDWAQTSHEEKLVREENFVMSELESKPLFSMENYQKQIEKQTQRHQEIVDYDERKMLERQTKNIAQMQKEKNKINCIPKCPGCGSTNVSKIGIVNRAVSVELVGLASNKIGKTHKCNNCGTTW